MKKLVMGLIRGYQKYVSPFKKTSCCIYSPTCSQYMLEAVSKYGAAKGIYLGLKRLFRCHPWHEGGYDPLP